LDVLYPEIEDSTGLEKGTWINQNAAGHWRYRKLLPIPIDSELPPLLIGNTPLINAKTLGQHLGCHSLHIKDETRNPSGSLKDRASSVAVCHAKWLGYHNLTAASTGNAGISLALWAAANGVKSHIFVPQRVTKTAETMLRIFGTRIYKVQGNYDQAFDQCTRAVERFGWYSRNTGTNPVLSEGKKTVALEIAEAMIDNPPDTVIVPVGDGCVMGGIWKGFQDAHTLGWISHLPRIYGIQSQGASPLADAFSRGDNTVQSLEPHTVADSIAVGNPRDAMKALRAANQSQGAIIAVPDEAILEAVEQLGRMVPVFVEPASAAPLAGLKELLNRGSIKKMERIVLIMTGSGLKDIDAVAKATKNAPTEIGPNPENLDHIQDM
jgi:threonine synthase